MSNLNLINWHLVISATVWITGLSIGLASASWADYTAAQNKTGWWQVMQTYPYALAVNVGLALFCLGWAVGPDLAWWERAVWCGLTLWFAFWLWREMRSAR